MIKSVGFIGTVYGEEDKLAIVSPADIASAIAEEITQPNNTKKVRYVSSDDRTCNEIATVLGKVIGMPDLQWLIIPEDQVLQALLANGIPANAAMNLVELGKATHSGILLEDFERNKSDAGKVTLEDFAKEFAVIYNQ